MKHHWIKVVSVPLLALALVACPMDKITGIDATANPATVASGATSSLSATVSGTGAFSPAVNWSIVSGGGSLSASTGSSVTYTAPSVTSSTTVQIKATSAGDSSVSKTIQVVVSAPSGTLALSIAGPTGIASFTPNVNVSGVAAPVVTLGDQNLTLPVGNATVTVNPVTTTGTFVDALSQGYIDIAGKPSSSVVSITQGATSKVSVAYNAGFTGQLWKVDNRTNFFGYNDTLLSAASGAITPSATLGAGANYRDMAFDKSGNVWITDQNNTIQEYSPSFELIQTITSNANSLVNPVGIAFDALGNLWVSNFDSHLIVKYNKASFAGKTGTNAIEADAVINTMSTANYYQIAFDKVGNLWAIDYQEKVQSKLYKFKAANLNSNPVPVVQTTLQTPKVYGISFDDAGNVWVAGDTGVYKYNPGDPTQINNPILLLTLNRTGNFNKATATAFDKAGNLWVCDANGIYQFSAAQIATASNSSTIDPAKIFTVDHFVQAIRFYPIPVNSVLYH
jgi:streptogramin lyase